MRNKVIMIICTAAVSFAMAAPALATQQRDPTQVAADAVVMRPALLAATIVGSAIFVAVLPVAAISKSVKSTAHALVVAPAKATFTRPLGDFDYNDSPPPGAREMAAMQN